MKNLPTVRIRRNNSRIRRRGIEGMFTLNTLKLYLQSFLISGRIIAPSRRKSIQKFVAVAVFLVFTYFLLFVLLGSNSSSFGASVSSFPFGFGSRGEDLVWVSPKSQPFNGHNEATNANHLIVVAGHSVVISGHLRDADVDEKDWYLLDYQKHQGLPQAIKAHISAGIKLASSDPQSLLIFSGGETRATTGPINEGSSYFRVADALNLWNPNGNNNEDEQDEDYFLQDKEDAESGFRNLRNGPRPPPLKNDVRARTTAEEFATDSFQNLLFSICRFYEVTGGRYPTDITVVSFTFKRHRFEGMHAGAIRWPSDRFHYVGVDPGPETGFDLEKSKVGEINNAAKPFETDPYGCYTEVLKEKREGRNPMRRTPPYGLSCPDMEKILGWCGPELIPIEDVPW